MSTSQIVPEVPARLHILLARKADTGVIIRRGPSKQVCVIAWNRKKDTFQLGQWLKGRIYERRCDLSPDGKHLIYFALNGRYGWAGGSWTAISKSPYLKAIGFWPNGGSTWNGGGLFRNNSSYWLNQHPAAEAAESRIPKKLQRDTTIPFEISYGSECPGVYYPRLQRDGWTLIEDAPQTEGITIFQKKLAKGWLLQKEAHEGGALQSGEAVYRDKHHLIHLERNLTIACPDWEWADQDRHRLVFAKGGVLYSTVLEADKLGAIKRLYDFNSMVFEAIKAPY